MFEIGCCDLAARTGRIRTNHGTVRTPAFVPVIHPVKQSIPASKMREMGFEMVITNAYIARKSGVTGSIHDAIGYDGAVMTDSGGYQVLEYGDLEVTPDQIRDYQTGIMSDIPVPLDRPTGFGLRYETAKKYVEHTLRVSKDTIGAAPRNGQAWMGPIQGGEHEGLVRRSARGLLGAGFKILALGSPVEFMESYEYRLLARIIRTAKQNIPHGVPVHLFGAGHPLTIPMAVALGCDTFDSASYMLYAKKGRYMTEDGTRRLSEMKHLPCPCEACSGRTAAELESDVNLAALHNLYAIRSEVDRVREAILQGRLWEYVMRKMRSHPRLYEAADVFVSSDFTATTPKFKERALFLFTPDDQFRPEITAYKRAVSRFRSRKKTLYMMQETSRKPGYLSAEYAELSGRPGFGEMQVCQYSPFLGPIPIELSDLYPAAHYVAARITYEPERFGDFGRVLAEFLDRNRFERITYDKGDAFLAYHMKKKRKETGS